MLDGHTIILFQTNIGHAGEWIDDILAQRESSLSAPILMSDALSHNQPTQVSVVKSLCNSHGRRNYAEMIASDPKELTELLKQYALIWAHDEHCQEQQLTEVGAHDLPQRTFLALFASDKTVGGTAPIR